MEKFKYVVLQGNCTESGVGDYWEVGSFETLEEAKKCLEEIYNDMRGISKCHNGYLETLIDKYGLDYEDKWLNIETIDGKRYYY